MSHLRTEPLDEKEFRPFAMINAEFGFIPNFFRAQTMRPDLIEAEAALINAILIKEGALTRRQKEYVFLVCSAANLSTYCVTAHCEIVRMLHIQGPEPEQIAVDHNRTDIPVQDKALLNFALKLNSQPTKFGRKDIEGCAPTDSVTSRSSRPWPRSGWRNSGTSSPSVSARSQISTPWSSPSVKRPSPFTAASNGLALGRGPLLAAACSALGHRSVHAQSGRATDSIRERGYCPII